MAKNRKRPWLNRPSADPEFEYELSYCVGGKEEVRIICDTQELAAHVAKLLNDEHSGPICQCCEAEEAKG